MPFSLDNLPDHVKNKIHRDDLAAFQAANNISLVNLLKSAAPLQLNPPLKASSNSKRELQSHSEFLAWIKKFNSLNPSSPILALHANPAKPSRINPGWPDFSLFHLASSPPLFIEFKASSKSILSSQQLAIRDALLCLGHSYLVTLSSSEAIYSTSSHFKLYPSQ